MYRDPMRFWNVIAFKLSTHKCSTKQHKNRNSSDLPSEKKSNFIFSILNDFVCIKVCSFCVLHTLNRTNVVRHLWTRFNENELLLRQLKFVVVFISSKINYFEDRFHCSCLRPWENSSVLNLQECSA